MATQVITDPIILDSTGQDIVDALNGIKDGVQPTNIYLDLEISIPTSGWSVSAPYTYTWTNSKVTTECGVEVHFKDGAETIDMSYLEYEKTIGGIIFTIDKVPSAAIPLVIRIINAKADAIIESASADMVTTNAVPGAANVEDALAIHETKVAENTEDIQALETAMTSANEEIAQRAKTLNGEPCDVHGDFQINEIEFARQLVTDDAQQSSGEFLFRTTGGDASLTDGPAKLVSIQGRSVHTGEVQESINMTVTMAERGSLDEPIEATIDRDTFVAYVDESGTTTLTYTDSWSDDPADYGITVTGTPIDGDVITVVYVKGDRGTITNSNPSAFTSTGWNLYDNTSGVQRARVKKYSDTYGFLIGGNYSGIEFSATLNGSREAITPASGYFTVPSDGYVFVSNGDATTYILMTWSDWGEGYDGDLQAYTESVVDLSAIMTNFPYGLMKVGSVADEINFSMKRAISRIERLAYTAENLETVIALGVAYDADEDYIYAVKATEDVYAITETGSYTASDHGIEFITGGAVPVFIQTLYGQNLVDKLRTDVLTKSADLVNNLTTNDPNKALSAAQGYALNSKVTDGYRGIAYLVGTTNGSTAIPAGSFVYVNNNGNGIADGLYTANEAIGAYYQITTSRVTAVPVGGGLNALNSELSRFGKFAIFSDTFSATSPGRIDQVVTLPSGIGKYFILSFYPGYSFADSVSLYFAQYNSADTPYWYGVQEIKKGSASRTVSISTDGIVTKGDANTYNTRIICFKVAT